jgi:hypothetical protein
LQALGIPAVCVVSDQFVGLASALLSTPGANGALDSPPSVVVVPYPVSGIEADAVVVKATNAGPDAAQQISAKLAEAAGRAEAGHEPA